MRHGRVLIVMIGRSWFVNVRFRALSGLRSDIAKAELCHQEAFGAARATLLRASIRIVSGLPDWGFQKSVG